MWDLWWTKWHWGRFSPSASVSPANHHSTNFSIVIITRGWHNTPIGGRSAEWTQLDTTPTIFEKISYRKIYYTYVYLMTPCKMHSYTAVDWIMIANGEFRSCKCLLTGTTGTSEGTTNNLISLKSSSRGVRTTGRSSMNDIQRLFIEVRLFCRQVP
jgi:hypothetical protein